MYLTVTGLVLDLIGVILMAIPIVTTDVSVIGTWGHAKVQKKDAIKAKTLTLTGLGLIAVGFILQIIAVFL